MHRLAVFNGGDGVGWFSPHQTAVALGPGLSRPTHPLRSAVRYRPINPPRETPSGATTPGLTTGECRAPEIFTIRVELHAAAEFVVELSLFSRRVPYAIMFSAASTPERWRLRQRPRGFR